MNDFPAGAGEENDAITFYCGLSSMMKLINLPQSKWATSAKQLTAIWKAEGQSVEAQTQFLW